ncbi:MAG: aminotransferase class I/II-fold pyridoxal phosphate-dependent enzyme, partial [Pseudobdellovibrio sp.]
METINYGKQDITQDDIDAVISALKSDFLTQGPLVQQFETDFAEMTGSTYAVAVINATAALHISALALGTKKGTRVLTSPNTFVASANCVRFCEGDVDFVDIDPLTLCMDLNKLEEKLKSSPKGTYQGVIPVSFAGYPVDTERIRRIADQYGLWIIEDAAHAPGAEFKNSKGTWIKTGSGEYADLTVFSFHPVKHLTTGEGGMITTRSKDLYEKLKLLRSHGITRDSSQFTRQE